MIIMDLKLDNFKAFKNFRINMSYPKKIVNSYIKGEHLKDRENFRYKKVNIIMGPNASGKTSLGKMIMLILNFIDNKQYGSLISEIGDPSKNASFIIEIVSGEKILYRIETLITPKKTDKFRTEDIHVSVKSVKIGEKDSYETCVKKLDNISISQKQISYVEELEKINNLTWMFTCPMDSTAGSLGVYKGENKKKYYDILKKVLKTLDPAIIRVDEIESLENSYVIKYSNSFLIVQEGEVVKDNILSSGTRYGIDVAAMLADMADGACGFYYCDEKFSYIHTDIEKALLSVMIDTLGEDMQLFFTTHNADVLDIPLPKHSFIFLRKNTDVDDEPISCVEASSLLKRNTDSVRNAVENDLFLTAPSLDLIYELNLK